MSVLLFALACASSSGDRPDGVARPEIVVRQAGSIFFGSSISAPLSIEVQIANRATVPLTVKEIEVTSPGMMQYGIDRTIKRFNETLAPGESRILGLVATAYTRETRTRSSEPLAIRAIVRFDTGGRGFREVVMEQFAGPGQ